MIKKNDILINDVFTDDRIDVNHMLTSLFRTETISSSNSRSLKGIFLHRFRSRISFHIFGALPRYTALHQADQSSLPGGAAGNRPLL